ncbi:carboxymuconolactone decarboxylase family protein [Marinilongibacter aquaticus]|uniref:carboxymuconolactone decarboxylase family protein n=1 Tax=Marinilongibacter aquaticus TaxID=2975157 RepID=UPI0021BD0727|nr:carboxymuconolactone decarboxylase family protein [Marinilongibacter aquaticus]UBM59532.1 carboxymuconolactone decarboxylase family protein [Marinilongibacter aquaticus]
MEKRVNINTAEPLAFKAMMGLVNYLNQTGLPKALQELIKIRASQINACAYCLDMHTKDALKEGEDPQRIFVLSAWRETQEIFSEKEKAALAITEEVTLIHDKGLSDETYATASTVFEAHEIAQIVMAVVTINAWNRIALSSHLPVAKHFA